MKADPNATAPNAMTRYATQMEPNRLSTRFDGTSQIVNCRVVQMRGYGSLSEVTYADIEYGQGDIQIETFHSQILLKA
jgi:hypothetical protein